MRKIYVNGESIGEILSRRNAYNNDEIMKLDRIIGHLKRNKKKYMKVIIVIAILVDLSGITLVNTTVATTSLSGLQSALGYKFTIIIDMLKFVVKYACLGMGLKEMIITILNGGNMKEASFAGIQYWLGYLFIEFYPTLFEI